MRALTLWRKGSPVRQGGLSLFCMATLVAPAAHAMDWTVTPSLNLSETYSDNITLAPRGKEQSEFITQINPGVSLTGDAPRLKLNLNYRMQNLLYAKDSSRNNIRHQLFANGTATLVEDTFFVDASSSIGQRIISGTGPVPLDNVSVTGNTTDVITFRVSPYLRHNFGSIASTEMRYSYDTVNYQAGGFNSASNTVSASLKSGPSFDQIPWGLNYRQQRINYAGSGAPDTKFEMVTGNVSYILTRKFSLIAQGGYEQNSYAVAASGQRPSGSFWSAGANWAPTSRTSLQATYGKRFFGTTYSFNLNHSTRRTNWQASYMQNVMTVRQLEFERRFFGVVDAVGNPFVDPVTGLPMLLAGNVPTLTNDVFIIKRLQGSVGYNPGRNSFTLTFFDQRFEFQNNPRVDESYGGQGSWSLRLAPNTTAITTAGWQRTDFGAPLNRQSSFWNMGVGLSRNINPHLTGSVNYRYFTGNSSAGGAGYAENRIIASLNMTF
ncbi:MAG: TIGR03016 family PEP-CTERM system-associated outer membrane protein [Gammaproteobacteria bacterium]